MKTHKILLLALIVSAVLSVSAQAGKHQGNNNDSPAPSRPARGNSANSGSGLHYGGRPTIAPSQRFSSYGSGMRSTRSAAFRADSFRPRSFNSGGGAAALSQRQFMPRTFSNSNGFARSENSRRFRTIQSDRFAQIQSDQLNRRENIQNRRNDGLGQFDNRRARELGTIQNNRVNRAGSIGNGNRGLAGGSNHVFARHSADWHRDWDRSRDHRWHGHRCRFVNGSWFIFDLGFLPWYGYPYDYYGYDYSYPYQYGYDPGVYDQGADTNYYNQGTYDSSDQNTDSTVAAAQERLARQGYYRGEMDGVFGPETRRAIMRYQRDNGLRATGYLTMDTRQSLGLRRAASY